MADREDQIPDPTPNNMLAEVKTRGSKGNACVTLR